MLVLTRKLQEKIRIGDQITITILRTKGKSVRLGIEAPLEVPVVRGELVFEDSAEQTLVEEISNEETMADVISADDDRTVAQVVRTMPRWETKSRHHLTEDRPPGNAPPQISLQRVPRSEVAQAIATPVGAGPLRAMLDRRSLTA